MFHLLVTYVYQEIGVKGSYCLCFNVMVLHYPVVLILSKLKCIKVERPCIIGKKFRKPITGVLLGSNAPLPKLDLWGEDN